MAYEPSPAGDGDIKIYYDTMSNKFYSNYTLSFALPRFGGRRGLRKTEKLLPSFLYPDIAYISSAHLSCHRLIHTHISAFEVIKKKIFILGFFFTILNLCMVMSREEKLPPTKKKAEAEEEEKAL